MSRVSEHIENLPTADWDELEAAVERFEDAWRRGERPSIDDYLIAGNVERRNLLRELVHQDLEYRLKAGESARVEAYLERYTELRSDREIVMGLIAAEYELRRRQQPMLAMEDYFRRFPQYRDELASRWKIDPPNRSECNPVRLGRFELLECVGGGAFGNVYRAQDPELDRTVAVKVPRVGGWRIREEARRAAQLRHPGIVTVHDIGLDGDRWYIVSDFVDGMTLATHLSQGRLPHSEAALSVAQVAEALHYAHLQGLVHRDVKPGNILLDRQGQPYLTDFGLAASEDELKSTGGTHAGTPAYMAPEQIRGEGHRIDARTDVYSLGVVLYELLCGRSPFSGESVEEVFRQIQDKEARPPRTIDDTIPRELERICLKAMSKRITDRYTTAKDMAEELRLAVKVLADVPGATAMSIRSTAGQIAGALHDMSTVSGHVTQRDSGDVPLRVMPKGLRSFGPEDAEFFLNLLPGPRDREGLPESVRFWKTRIESRDPDGTFVVGLIYGPSGCGKSSLVKAGLLPQLAKHVLPVYVEATREHTEARLAKSVLTACPGLNPEDSLVEIVGALRRGRGLGVDQKVLIVLDQFEQWLHARGRAFQNGELVAALRQVDGRRVQCVLMVRDDFWAATNRLFHNLELSMVEDRNVRLVDLFDLQHAHHVLELFGAAYGRLPINPAGFSQDQVRFLDQAISDLSQDGMVIPVRLSLFADLMKGRPWTLASLAEVGGTEGVGLKFLEETFTARTAVPEHRAMAQPARALLQALLPEPGTDIKGRMRSRRELARACGLSEQSAPFARLLQFLDRELHVITPTEAEASGEGHEMAAGNATSPDSLLSTAESFYQLTHDYLIPPLRQWLTHQQRRTWRGRAELRLAELSVQWSRSRDNRFLPLLTEFVPILFGVPRAKHSVEQRALIRAATRHYGTIVGLVTIMLTLLGWVGWEANGRVQAQALIQQILATEPERLGELILIDLPPYWRWADSQLKALANDGIDSRQRLRASLAIVSVDNSPVGFLKERMLDCELDEFPIICSFLQPYHETLGDELWQALRDRERAAQARFRAGLALARYASLSDQWTGDDTIFLTAQLLSASADFHKNLKHLQPIGHLLVSPLESAFYDTSAPDLMRVDAAHALAEFAAHEPERLARLASDALPEQYRFLYPVLVSSAPRTRVKAKLVELAEELPAPELSEAQRLDLGRRRAGAAITLLRMGEYEAALAVLRVREDRESQAQFVHRLREREVQPNALVDCLKLANEDPVRLGLLLALGEFKIEDLPVADREPLINQFRGYYHDDPDPGIHSAAEWVLRRWGQSPDSMRTAQEPIAMRLLGKRRWYVNSQSHTMALIPGPVEFQMGSPSSEQGRSNDEQMRRVVIPRAFAVATKKTTHQQFLNFLRQTGVQHRYQAFAPEPDEPENSVTWFEAVMYCRWLSEQERIAEDQMCYPPIDEIKPGLTLPPDYLTRSGYRLPTESEWEYVCRAGSTTSRFYGHDKELLAHYAWYVLNTDGLRTAPVGTKKPNDLGLFDAIGNAWDWCQDWYSNDPIPHHVEQDLDYSGRNRRVLRGGSYLSGPLLLRSAHRNDYGPDAEPNSTVGFRVARTVPE